MKTIEAARKYAISEICESPDYADSFPDEVYACIKDFKAGVKFAEEWISVKDHPDNDDIVLIKSDNDCILTGYWHGNNSGFICYGMEAYKNIGKITHWRPINRK